MRAPQADIAIFLKSLAGGGAQRVMLTLAEAFAARGLRVDLLLAQRSGAWLDRVPGDVRLIDLGDRSPWQSLPSVLVRGTDLSSLYRTYSRLQPPRVFGAIPALARYLATARPRAMLSAVDFTNLAALCAAAQLEREACIRIRQVASFHTHLSSAIDMSHHRRMRALPPLLRRWLPRAAGIAACSTPAAEDLARLAGIDAGRIETIPNPIPVDRVAIESKCQPDHPWARDRRTPLVLSVGRLAPEKGHATLLEAFARLRSRRRARLVILGEGPERPRLTELARTLGIAEDVALPGFVENPHGWMKRANLFVLPSHYEGLGCALVEALACGTSALATRAPGGVGDVLGDGRFGQLVPVGDAASLAEAMAARLDRPFDPETLVHRAADFSVGPAVDLYLELLLGTHSGVR